MGFILDPPVAVANQAAPSPRRVTGGESINPNLVNAITARFRASENLSGLADGVGIKTIIIAADSEHRFT
jgi:hypothetical protein